MMNAGRCFGEWGKMVNWFNGQMAKSCGICSDVAASLGVEAGGSGVVKSSSTIFGEVAGSFEQRRLAWAVPGAKI